MVEPLKQIIKKTVQSFFLNLNSTDINILSNLTTYIVDMICYRSPELFVSQQFLQNNARDIKGIILLLLPFIDDKNNSYLLQKIRDLNQLLYSQQDTKIPEYIYKIRKEEILSSHFEFGNMGLGLIPDNGALNLFENNEKLIYKLIFHNFLGTLQTLEIMNGKYYVNWINVVPLNLNNYMDSYIFKQTNLNTINTMTNYAGLWHGDFYNIMRNKYYEDAIPIRWLIFPYEYTNITTGVKNQIYLIQGLERLFNINTINTINIGDFRERIIEIYTKLIISESILGFIDVDFIVLKYLLVHMVKDTKFVFNKFKLDEKDADTTIDEYSQRNSNKIASITNQDIISCLSILIKSPELIWNYLKECVENLKASVYGKFLMKDNLIISDYYYYKTTTMNLKNIYNIAKSLSHTTDWVQLDKNYISLDYERKQEFLNRINSGDNTWLNLSKNLSRQFINISSNVSISSILSDFRNNFTTIIFEELICSGLLNKIESNLEITDKSVLPSTFISAKEYRKKLLENKFKKNNDDWMESYYYLTNDKFKNLNKIRFEKKKGYLQNDKYEELSYFQLIIKDHEWQYSYAMDYISQISFFKHYIYHQIIYTTGATGQGKSTQFPKLLLYALKVVDYKSNGKVACTQPRITPTVENSTRIADEVGLPIHMPSNTSDIKIKTNNMNIQFKYMGESFTSDNMRDYYLRVMTDGTLIETLYTNPTLYDNNMNKNIYDIIIVDEAHEHNTNMDLIITLCKQTCYYNNMVRLVIVSATMDDDEPIYRRYFRDNNDNLLFPIKHSIKFMGQDFLPNANLMDRRYHISPPGETTQYTVYERYEDENPTGKNMKEMSKMSQENGYNKIIEICNTSNVGDILFFANGMNEIMEAIEYLNKTLPPNVIALPYYAELSEFQKNIIANIDSKISTITNKRENIHAEWGTTKVSPKETVPTGTYNRAIIIATTVAEASITISSLRYVVDNGYSKVGKFRTDINLSSLEVDEISESSRIQRKGRVGRVGDGTVYFMYKKDAKKMIRPKYKITDDDFCPTFLKLLGSKTLSDCVVNDKMNYNKLILSDRYNPNVIPQNPEQNSDTYTYKNLHEIYMKNYRINNKNLDPIYYENTINHIKTEYMAFDTGQLLENVLDTKGCFYLIHPFENKIKRNVLNQIIEYNGKITDKINQGDFAHITGYLLDKNMIIDYKAEELFNNNYYIMNIERTFILSELAQKYKSISSKFNKSIPDTISLLAASAMGCFNEVMKINIFIEKLSNGMSDIAFNKITPEKNWGNFKKFHKDAENKSDIIFIYNIIKKLVEAFPDLFVFNYNSSTFNNKLNHIYQKKIEQFNKYSVNNSNDPIPDFEGGLWNKLLNLKRNRKLYDDYYNVFRKDPFTSKITMKDINDNIDRIKSWARNNKLDTEFIINYMYELSNQQITKNISMENEDIMWATQLSTNFNKYLTTGTIEEKILRSYLYGKSNQFTISLDKPITLINKTQFPVSFAKILNNREIDTITNISNEMTFYNHYSIDPENDNLNIKLLSAIDTEWLIPAFPILMNPLLSHGSDRYKRHIINAWNQNYFVWDSDMTPILKYFYKEINKRIF